MLANNIQVCIWFKQLLCLIKVCIKLCTETHSNTAFHSSNGYFKNTPTFQVKIYLEYNISNDFFSDFLLEDSRRHQWASSSEAFPISGNGNAERELEMFNITNLRSFFEICNNLVKDVSRWVYISNSNAIQNDIL